MSNPRAERLKFITHNYTRNEPNYSPRLVRNRRVQTKAFNEYNRQQFKKVNERPTQSDYIAKKRTDTMKCEDTDVREKYLKPEVIAGLSKCNQLCNAILSRAGPVTTKVMNTQSSSDYILNNRKKCANIDPPVINAYPILSCK